MKRKKTPGDVEASVLTKCRRRCALCFGLRNDLRMKKGQVAHIDRNPANAKETNLVWLCLTHHDEYDSKSSQSKGLTIAELKHYKKQLLSAIKGGALESARLASQEARKHDQKLFLKYDSIMPEARLRALVHRLQSDDSYTRTDVKPVLSFLDFSGTTGSAYLHPVLIEKLGVLKRELGGLSSFLSSKFFVYPKVASMSETVQYCLYPHLNSDREGDGTPASIMKYDAFQQELDALCQRSVQAYEAYRVEAKRLLAV